MSPSAVEVERCDALRLSHPTVPSELQLLTPPTIPWFGPCGASLRPGRTSCRPPRAAAVKDGRHVGARPQGLSLTAASTVARWRGTGRRGGSRARRYARCPDRPFPTRDGGLVQACPGQTSVSAGKYPKKSFSLFVNNGECSHSA